MGLKLILVRHAEAVGEEDAGSDRDRWLSGRGRESARRLAQLLLGQNIAPTTMVSSPLPRAVQTAEILAAALEYFGTIESWRCLEPGAHPRVAAGDLAACRPGVVIAVSHEPTISQLGAFVLGRPSFPPFRTAQACAIVDGRPDFTARADVNQVQALFVD
jgi:phosphohistidine phosphatase